MGTTAETFTKRYTVKFISTPLSVAMGHLAVDITPPFVRERTISAANDEHAILRASRLAYPEESVEITAEDGRRVPV